MLHPAMEKFILHWGEMGEAWGLNRSVAQVHALLYLQGRPMQAEEIAQTLSLARSNVSNSLKELQGWGLIRIVHVLGDRRDHYESLTDVWEMFRRVLAERRRREVEPTIRTLRACVEDAEAEPKGTPAGLKKRIAAMLDFLETADACYLEMSKLPTESMMKLVGMGGKIKQRLRPKSGKPRG